MSEPAAFPVLLMECFLAGFQSREAARYWDQLRIGEALALVREPGNPHDPRAVRVDWLGTTLGYLPRDANFTVSQMLDREEYVEARIAAMRSSGDPAMRILLEVIAMANPKRGLPSLYDARPEDEKPELKQLSCHPGRSNPSDGPGSNSPSPLGEGRGEGQIAPKQIVETLDLDMNKLIRGLAWMLAGKAIGKAKGAAVKR
jgi:hypothetical protein